LKLFSCPPDNTNENRESSRTQSITTTFTNDGAAKAETELLAFLGHPIELTLAYGAGHINSYNFSIKTDEGLPSKDNK